MQYLTALRCLQGSFYVVSQSGAPELMDLTGVQWIQADQPATARLYICQLLRQPVKVWWPDDRRYYQGTVAEYMLDTVGMQHLRQQIVLACYACSARHVTLLKAEHAQMLQRQKSVAGLSACILPLT